MLTFGANESSNAFASGARQNCQNVLTNRPSTRVAAPPGGRSSINLSWDEPTRLPEERVGAGGRAARNSSDTFDSRAPQHCKNFTPRTRVEAPSGARPSINLAWDHDSQRSGGFTPASVPYTEDEDAYPCYAPSVRMAWDNASECSNGFAARTPISFGGHAAGVRSITERATPGRNEALEYNDSHCSARTPASGVGQDDIGRRQAPRNSSNVFASGAHQNCHNVLTDVPSTRVKAPPGGRSSINLAWDTDEPCSAGPTWSLGPRGPLPTEDYGGFGRRATRSSSNAFASGACQNSQNALTDSPTTRVQAPPGGRSSLSLGFDDAPRHSYGHMESCTGKPTCDGSTIENCAGQPTCDASSLRSLKARMSRRQSSAASPAASGSQVCDGGFGYGDSPVFVGMSQRSASAPRLRAKDEVEGSQPRKWKPAKAPRAPPANEHEVELKFSKKRFPDMGAGSNRDANAMEALRFFQAEERLGKLPVAERQPAATKRDRDSHRYYLSAEGKADLTPGKAYGSFQADGQAVRDRSELLVSESTSAGSASDAQSDCDSLPLGAEWSSYRF